MSHLEITNLTNFYGTLFYKQVNYDDSVWWSEQCYGLASVCLSRLFSNLNTVRGAFNVTHQGAACDAASVHFGPTIKMTDILVFILLPYRRLYNTWSVSQRQ